MRTVARGAGTTLIICAPKHMQLNFPWQTELITESPRMQRIQVQQRMRARCHRTVSREIARTLTKWPPKYQEPRLDSPAPAGRGAATSRPTPRQPRRRACASVPGRRPPPRSSRLLRAPPWLKQAAKASWRLGVIFLVLGLKLLPPPPYQIGFLYRDLALLINASKHTIALPPPPTM